MHKLLYFNCQSLLVVAIVVVTLIVVRIVLLLICLTRISIVCLIYIQLVLSTRISLMSRLSSCSGEDRINSSGLILSNYDISVPNKS